MPKLDSDAATYCLRTEYGVWKVVSAAAKQADQSVNKYILKAVKDRMRSEGFEVEAKK